MSQFESKKTVFSDIMEQADLEKKVEVDVVPPVLLKPKEAAHALRISERLLWQLTMDGSIKCKKVGKLVRYRRRDIEQWSES